MALYHKYRPQTFEEIVGQNHVTKTLKNQLKEGDFAHAYLFSGPRGIGKTTTARILAKSLNCPKDDGVEPDNNTQCAKEIENSRSIDVIEIDAASHTKKEEVKEQIVENVQFQPTKLDYKVFIIDEVHMLSQKAFNALLKTLEEPPEYVVFVLATTEPDKLPDTVVSRCQRFDFKKISHDLFKEYLKEISEKEDIEVPENILDRIINKSDGCIRDGISLLDQLNAASDGKITEESASLVLPKAKNEDALEFLNILIARDTKEGLKKVNKLAQEGVHMPEFTLDCIEQLRYMMMKKAKAKSNRAGVDFTQQVKKTLNKYAKTINYNDIVNLIDLFLNRKEEIKQAPLPQLPVELLILQWCESNPKDKEQPRQPTKPDEAQAKKTADADKKEEKQNNNDNKKNQNTQKTTENSEDIENDSNQRQEKKGQIEKVQKTEQNQEESPDSSDQNLLNEAKQNWDKFIEEIEDRSPSLVFILKMARAINSDEDTVKIEVKYGFHKQKLTQKGNQQQVEKALSAAIDKEVSMNVTVKTEDGSDEEVEEIAAALGGEVVN